MSSAINNQIEEKRMYCKIIEKIAILLTITILLITSPIFSEVTHVQNILIINSYHYGLSWTDDATLAEIDYIKSNYSGDVKIYVEYMDWKEHPTKAHLDLFYSQMAYKYKEVSFDLIITSDDAALEFALSHRASLFNNAPMIFNGVSEERSKTLLEGIPKITGVVETVDVDKTVQLATQLNPSMTAFYVIYDQTESGKSMGKTAIETIQKQLPHVAVYDITDLSIDEIVDRVSQFQPTDSVLMTAYYTDINGRNINFEDMIEKVSHHSPAPVFSLYDFAIGKGALGGTLLSARLIGERTGALAVDILNGSDPDQLEWIRTGFHINAIDYEPAIRFGLNIKTLDESLEVMNRPLSIYELYKGIIWTTIGIIFALVLFLLILSHYLRHNIKLKHQLIEKNFEQKLLYDEISASEEELKAQFDALNELFEELQESKEQSQLILDAIKDSIMDWHIKDDKVYFSDKWEAAIGYTKDQITDQRFIYGLIHEEDQEKIKAQFSLENPNTSSEFTIQVRMYCKSGALKWFLVRGVVKKDPAGSPIRVICSFTDIDDIKQMENQMRFSAYHDALTKFPNRRALEHDFDKLLSQETRHIALLHIDIDNFKRINDTMGHVFGDKYIFEVGLRLKSMLIKEASIYRLGGDEFIIIVSNTTGEALVAFANRLSQRLNETVHVAYSNFSNSISIGIALFPEDGSSMEMLLTKADLAMYKAKELGRGQVTYFENQMYEKIVWRLNRENLLKEALSNNELFLMYQPQVDIKTKKITGFEALIRWQNSTLGFVPPTEFIPIAEETQLIMPIGAWVIDTAFDFIKQTEKFTEDQLSVAVNISVLQLVQENFETILEEATSKHQILPSQVVLEITETVLMQAMDVSISKLERLRSKGYKIALDDFGKGYSSLSYLKELPINILKIDKSFIEGLGISDEKESLVQMIIQMGKYMRLKLVAEGVETEQQWSALERLDCDALQGYYFARPLSELDAMKRIS